MSATEPCVCLVGRFIKAARPNVIVINTSGGMICKSRGYEIERRIVAEVREELLRDAEEQRYQPSNSNTTTNEYRTRRRTDAFDIDESPFEPQVLFCKDDIAVLYGNTRVAAKMFPNDYRPSLK
jgi:hypothetical protein